jgi:ubiquinone/menaquinone biosynthesis C-methylase UbiE
VTENVARERVSQSGYDLDGFASVYDAARPRPPASLLDVIARIARTPRPELVVDLGSGTGLSTLAWADRAEHVVGVEANPSMLEQARARADALGWANVRFELGFAHHTGIDARAADVVTAAQALHWMDPEPTLAEVARILRPGGVFAAYDYDWPPTVDWEVEAAFAAVVDAVPADAVPFDSKDGHLGRLEASGHFRYAREVVAHSVEEGTADRLVQMALSLGLVARALRAGDQQVIYALDHLRATAERRLGRAVVPFHIGYRARIAVR